MSRFMNGLEFLDTMRGAVNVEALSTTKTLVTTDYLFQWLDPNGSSQDVILPAEASSSYLMFIILNTANGAGEDLVILNDGAATIATLEPGMTGVFSCDGTNWKWESNTGVLYDAVDDTVTLPTIDSASINYVFITSGTPSSGIGTLNDIAIDEVTGSVWKKEEVFGTTLSGTFYPTTGSDDGYWKSTGVLDNTLGWIAMGDGNGVDNNGFIRFRSLNLDNSAQIVSAYVKFYASFNDTTTVCNLNIYLNDEDSAVAPTTGAQADALALTTGVAWDAIPTWTSGNYYDTPDITTAIQEVVNRAGWASGNNAMVLLKNNASDNLAKRNPDSFEHTGSDYPALHLEWKNPTGVYQWVEQYESPFSVSGTSITPNTPGNALDATAIGTTTPAVGYFTNILEGANEVFVTSGTPSDLIGTLDDVAINENTGDVYTKDLVYGTLLSGTFYPTTGSDDGQWRPGYFYNAGSWLPIGNETTASNRNAYCRFRSLNLDNSAQIVSAYVKFYSHFTSTTTVCNLDIYFNDEDSAVAPTSEAQADALALTSVVPWDNVPGWTVSNFYDTVDISTALQEVLDRAGWVYGNDAMVVIKADVSDNGAVRNPDSYEASGSYYPALHVEWKNPTGVYQWVLHHRANTLVRTDAGAADYNPSALTTNRVIVVDNSAAVRNVIIPTEDIESATTSIVRLFIIQDEYNSASTYPITITLENGGTINGEASYVIKSNGDKAVLYVDGTNGFIAPDKEREDVNTETLSGTKTLTVNDYILQWLDPDGFLGSGRDVILPAEALSTYLMFIIVNTANDSIETLTVKNDGGTTIGAIGPGMTGIFSCDGTNWKWISETGVFYDAIGNRLGIDTVAPTSLLSIGGDSDTLQSGHHNTVNIRPIPLTAIDSDTYSGLTSTVYVDPPSNSSSSFRGMDLQVASEVGNTVDMTILNGLYNIANHKGLGTVSNLAGAQNIAWVLNAGNVGTGFGAYNIFYNDSSGNTTTAYGSWSGVRNGSGAMGTAYSFASRMRNYLGTITDAYNFYSDTPYNTGTITNLFQFYAKNPASGGTITNNYGVYIENQTEGATNFSIYSAGGINYLAGSLGLGVIAPNTLLDVQGGQTGKVTTVNAATYSLLVTDFILHVTYTGTGAVAVTLPTAQSVSGRMITVKDAGNNAGTNNITISTQGAELIEFGASVIINANGNSVDIYSDGTDWFVR